MAYVLSLTPQSPLKRSFSDTPYLTPTSPPVDDGSSCNTVLQPISANASARSPVSPSGSLLSLPVSTKTRHNENTPPTLTPQSLRSLVDSLANVQKSQRHFGHSPRKPSWGTDISPPPRYNTATPSIQGPVCEPLRDANTDHKFSTEDFGEEDGTLYNPRQRNDTPFGPPFGPIAESENSEDDSENLNCFRQVPTSPGMHYDPSPFKRWMSALRRRNLQKNDAVHMHGDNWGLETPTTRFGQAISSPIESGHRKSESQGSSVGFITAVKSASITLASTSIAPFSARTPVRGRRRGETRSSGISGHRPSSDSMTGDFGPIMDEQAWLRSVQRRKILEELIETEENYIDDMKALINVYFTLLASSQMANTQSRISIRRNVAEILELHEDLLGELHKVVPNAEPSHGDSNKGPGTWARKHKSRHTRWHSADIPARRSSQRKNRRVRHSLDYNQHSDWHCVYLTADTHTVAEVAKVFNKFALRFFAYETYHAHYNAMNFDRESTKTRVPEWERYERGIEALSGSIIAANRRAFGGKKSMTFQDLLAKPIQRVLKYPLLFADLRKQTPVCDDPEAYGEVDKALSRLQVTASEINNAVEDPRTRTLIESTWRLQDRLVFEDRDCLAPGTVLLRLLGHAILCGVLHVAFQGRGGIEGQYMVCVLFRSCMLLAVMNKGSAACNVVATIPLLTCRIQEADNGKGLQCHTALYTWKLAFAHECQLYEMIMSACSAIEEQQWRGHLQARIDAESHDGSQGEPNVANMFSSISMGIKPAGTTLGSDVSVNRRNSIHRAATLGAKATIHQVIIKNTQAQKQPDGQQGAPVGRSHSHMTTNTIPTLAPRRGERVRLENALADVWTRDILPFPGMGQRRPENPIRASANSVMRKLSMASLASNFSKRSNSYSNGGENSSKSTREPNQCQRQAKHRKGSWGNTSSRGSSSRPPPVDFHNSPARFLPAGIGLERPPRRASRFRGALGESSSIERMRESARALSFNGAILQRIDSAQALELFRSPTPTQRPAPVVESGAAFAKEGKPESVKSMPKIGRQPTPARGGSPATTGQKRQHRGRKLFKLFA
ncbi:hypothetical protein BDY21DRAFT_284534 [Lineolata rhizophorae]|uniref:DH domain-containing protein n=1 Tax=Lineolata rhizophorae TaxID=578093 RepID=A0A6A6P373_9PEZI|nr:hypothetical protein BDY21DRAFT_284534 [Lineolata rhizophorae]